MKICDKFESMHLNLILKNTTYNFVASYKSPNTDENSFLENLDNIVSSLNFDDPLFMQTHYL